MSALINSSLALLFLFSAFVTPNDASYSLTVEVKGLRNSTGEVQFALYNKDGTIPDEHFEKYYKLLKAEIIDGASTVLFENIPQGTYAVNILHDENKNGEIDKGFILPKEGIGFSNIASIGLRNKPSFSKASFDLKSDRTIEVKVIYM
ncbi:MAG: DUF2141 domain-containing protein [Flavobacteriales bacterium]|nr:DUF2141 domain-containing protein [Flavobacteriales bacterium]MBK6892903.1 DUF2141 domain-containing protein [Flavobacteriales bacterium]MBK7247412.1 DUF2141 domain-containing protein [Flavobacteriales bacterium]MBK9061348.1 DUF2141 domain-containing protein [Flavobacteriales bacterium]MBK9596782.1 DUF2141 domain-containing protein [Flavobacteriales bacterium]